MLLMSTLCWYCYIEDAIWLVT